jgi:Transposase DNA-binding
MKNSSSVTAAALTCTAFNSVQLGDLRLTRRLSLVCHAIEKNPSASFPNIFGSKSELDGFYRLVNNVKVSAQNIFEEACSATARRAQTQPEVLAIHDTTVFSFPGEAPIEGLGRVTDKTQGFFGHFCIGVNLKRELLGLLGLKSWIRAWQKKGKRSAKEIRADDTNEERRWTELIQDVQGK